MQDPAYLYRDKLTVIHLMLSYNCYPTEYLNATVFFSLSLVMVIRRFFFSFNK